MAHLTTGIGTAAASTDRKGQDLALWPRFRELEQVLQNWQAAADRRIRVTVAGTSLEGRPIYVAMLTDPDVPDETKQHVVLTAMHTGGERSSATTLFAVMHWLLSEDPAAHEVLRRQVIACLPVVHPDGYDVGRLAEGQLARHGRIYSGWNAGGAIDPMQTPEAAVVQRMLDRLQPDLYADVHGVSCDFAGQVMLESSAASPTILSSRPYHQEIARLMDQAALEAGFPSDNQPDDCELLYWGPAVNALSPVLWHGQCRWSPGLYAYARYHTLYVLMEITWPASGLARFKRLLQIGNERWETECEEGYPNHVVGAGHPTGMYHMVVGYGQTADQRRASRVELWSRHAQITEAMIDPQQAGKSIAVYALSQEARERWLTGHEEVSAFVDYLELHPDVDAGPVREFLRDWPSGQNLPYPAFRGRHQAMDGDAARGEEPIRNGIAFRLRLPFAEARIVDLRVNGRSVGESVEDGYVVWRGRGFLFVQVNIPPPKLRSADLFVITCRYDPGQSRTLWNQSNKIGIP